MGFPCMFVLYPVLQLLFSYHCMWSILSYIYIFRFKTQIIIATCLSGRNILSLFLLNRQITTCHTNTYISYTLYEYTLPHTEQCAALVIFSHILAERAPETHGISQPCPLMSHFLQPSVKAYKGFMLSFKQAQIDLSFSIPAPKSEIEGSNGSVLPLHDLLYYKLV